MKGLRNFFVLLLVLSSIGTSASAASGVDKARAAAEESLRMYKGLPDPTKFNFTTADELQTATLGDFLPVYAFDVEALANGASTLGGAMVDANMQEFMVKAGERNVTRLTVRKTEDSYVRYRFGGSGSNLARGLSALPKEARPEVRLVVLGAAEFLYVGLPNQELLVSINAIPVGGIPTFEALPGQKALGSLKELATGMLKDDGAPGGGFGSSTGPTEHRDADSGWMARAFMALLLAASGLRYYLIRSKIGAG